MITLIYHLIKKSRNRVLLGLVDVTMHLCFLCHHPVSLVMLAWSLNLSPHRHRRLQVHTEVTAPGGRGGTRLLFFYFYKQESFLGTISPFLCVSQIKSMPHGHYHKTCWEDELWTLWLWPRTVQYLRPKVPWISIKIWILLSKKKEG